MIEPKLLHMITVLQVGNILTSHVSYGAILARNSTDFLKCFNEYVQTEEQWLYYILAENTGTTQVGLTKEAATIFYTKEIIIWQGSLEVNPYVLIGSYLVGISPHGSIPRKRLQAVKFCTRKSANSTQIGLV